MITLGLENCLAQRPPCLEGARIGVLLNRASVDRQYVLASDRISDAYPGQVAALFTPQHGLWGDAQANMVETDHGWHEGLNVPIYSLYHRTRRPTPEMLSKIDTLVIDLQDVGTRVYTFVWTLHECLKACAQGGVSVLVLDRPNPVGGTVVEGPRLDPAYRSFVGGASIPMRHGLTMAELAQWLNGQLADRADLQVVPMTDWAAKSLSVDQGWPWLPPSPNLPTLGSARVYPGQVLLEGTNLSEGRGTTTPFEFVGAPYVDCHQLCDALMSRSLPGVTFLPAQFRPTFDKWSGQLCGGVSIHVIDPPVFRPYRMTLELMAIVREIWPRDFAWLDPPYEYETEKPPIDIISGNDAVRTKLSTATVAQLCEIDQESWQSDARPALLYDR